MATGPGLVAQLVFVVGGRLVHDLRDNFRSREERLVCVAVLRGQQLLQQVGVGGVLGYLCSPAAGFVTGTTLSVDGGIAAYCALPQALRQCVLKRAFKKVPLEGGGSPTIGERCLSSTY